MLIRAPGRVDGAFGENVEAPGAGGSKRLLAALRDHDLVFDLILPLRAPLAPSGDLGGTNQEVGGLGGLETLELFFAGVFLDRARRVLSNENRPLDFALGHLFEGVVLDQNPQSLRSVDTIVIVAAAPIGAIQCLLR